MPIDLDKYTAEFWKYITVGQSIILSDEQAVEDALKAKNGTTEMDYIIKSIRHIEDEDTGIVWRFFQLESEDNIWFLVKIVDQEFDLRVYFEPDDFAQGDREDLIKNECHWVFEEPDNLSDFKLNDLEFTKLFTMGDDEDEVEYSIKPVGMLTGMVTNDPPSKGIDNSMACVVEYHTGAEVQNTEAMFIEIGGEESESGGFIMMLMGNPISQEDVEVL